MEKPGVCMMELDRFGYTLRVVGRTKEEAEKAMQDAYIEAYARRNHLEEPSLRAALSRPVVDGYGELSEIDAETCFVIDICKAFNDAYVCFYEFGKVEWE